jgi:hypothetical protein
MRRRTISLQPPFDGQQINIFGFFFDTADEVTVGDCSVVSNGPSVD